MVVLGPIEGTIEDMWRLVHDNQSQVIIMLTNLVESGKVYILMSESESYPTRA